MVRINLRSCIMISILFFAAMCPSTFGKTIFVDGAASGANDGSSWENAYTFLQDALADSNSAEEPVEIRVAQGIYKPDQGSSQTSGDRRATFQLMNGVTLKGGFAGISEADPNVRDIAVYETVLSGDLNGDDSADFDNNEENNYHVVTSNSTNETAAMDGFIITSGNANGPGISLQRGGGMYNYEGSPILTNCTFYANIAFAGGGMFNTEGSNLSLTNCTFLENSADFGGGGGMYIHINSSPILTNCIFSGNDVALSGFGGGITAGFGGGITNFGNPILTNCTFIGNSAAYGGGMRNYSGSPILTNCLFVSNSASFGGGMQNYNSSPILTHCVFSGNEAKWGGGIRNDTGGHATLTGCLFTHNQADLSGGGIFIWSDSTLKLTNCTFAENIAGDGNALFCTYYYGQESPTNVEIINCIICDGQNGIWNNNSSTISLVYSNVEGGKTGVFDPHGFIIWSEGNIHVDPLFADPENSDYHLKSEAGRWDPNNQSWVVDDVTSPCIDAGDPNSPVGDEPDPNGGIINMGAYGGTAEASMSMAGAEEIVYVQWLGHSTVKVWTDDCIVYVDPERVPESLHDATLVCVTHTHGDHYSPSDIAKVSNAETQFIGPPDVVQRYGGGQTIAPGQTIEFDFINVTAVPAYNINKTNHPKSNNWVGYIIELGGKRIYVAGDTDLIDEMKSLGDIDVAFLPAGGTYTMNATEAAEATGYIKPDLAIPYHWGQSVGTLADAQRFVEFAQCPAMVLTVGEMISSDDWPEYSPLIAHWALDETEGGIAYDSSADENHGTLNGGPAWQPVGKIDGALELDGVDDYISANFVLDPAKGSFSIFAWIKGDVPGQVIISQADGTGSGETWLGVDPSLGKLMTGLVPPPAGRFVPQPLVSESIITDGQWHHIGFAWDGSYRALYADGIEIARDAAAQNPLKSADGGMYIGAGKNHEAGTFFCGLIDNVQIYNTALSAEEIGALAE